MQRVAKRQRYDRYRTLCKQAGVSQQHHRWYAHLEELLNGSEFRRLTKAELFAFWRERLTDEQIFEIGGNLG
jgi:hypothetical protein